MKEPADGMKLPSVTIDFRVPLWQIVAAFSFFVAGLIGMYYQLAQLSESVIEVKATLRVNNTQTMEFAREQAVMKFRLDSLERERGEKK